MPHQYTTKEIARFNSKVKVMPNGCWEWQGYLNRDGYGRIRVGGNKKVYAHRMAYEISVRPIPDGLLCLHSCDNPRCCNPSHLWLGTDADNSKDRDEKGRTVILFGEKHGNAKLTEDDVRTIRIKYKAGFKQTFLAKQYGVSQPVISDICLRKRWKHIT